MTPVIARLPRGHARRGSVIRQGITMEMLQLEQFLAIIDAPSMRAAADRLYISQPALSHNLRKLEDELGCRLFDRSNSALILNDYGRIVEKYARGILGEVGDLRREVEEEQRRQAARLEVGCYALAFQNFILPQLANALPTTVIESHIDAVDALAARLADGTLDLLFTYRPLEKPGFVNRKLFDEQAMLSLPSSSQFATRSCVYLSDLAQVDLDRVTDARGYYEWFSGILEAAGIDIGSVACEPLEEYLLHKDAAAKSYLTSSFIMRLVPFMPMQVIIPVADSIAARGIYLSYREASANKVANAVEFFDVNAERYFGSYLRYLAFPERIPNLVLGTDSESESTDSR